LQERRRGLESPVGRLAVVDVGDQQRELARTGASAARDRVQETMRGRRPVGNDKDPDAWL
jgi:hypothetical protein